MRKMIDALSTPSETVQKAVALGISPLAKRNKDLALELLKELLSQLLNSKEYAKRRGAAFGIAGIGKGAGLGSLRKAGVISRLNEVLQMRQNNRYREGALMAVEIIVVLMGRVFEPYIIQMVPSLLDCFGDTTGAVREAAMYTVKVIMTTLTQPGVKLILPGLLDTIEKAKTWRAKCAAAEMLGEMSNCAPRQLAIFLPQIIPMLQTTMTDSHTKVAAAGEASLLKIGDVVQNPEIKNIRKYIIDALADPAEHASSALDALIETEFVHEIDTSSLALIMPIVSKSLIARSAEVRRKSAVILSNMYKLTDAKDIEGFIDSLLPSVQKCILDPVPDVRTASSKALGVMMIALKSQVEKSQMILSWLFEKLKSNDSTVDRMGAAQGISEVLHGAGTHKLDEIMPRVLEYTEDKSLPSHIRDGYSMLFIYLPKAFGDAFLPYVGKVIKPVLSALADQSEYVRETALKAGQVIVKQYCEIAIGTLLPELEVGIQDGDWRIRQASVTLLGDMMFHISGISGKGTSEGTEEENFGSEEGLVKIRERIGTSHLNNILAGLYLGRNDVTHAVRTVSLHVWKLVVSNTARTLKSILPDLIIVIVSSLSSEFEDARSVAAKTLGDLVKKLGDKLLPEIIPIMEEGLTSEDEMQRQGICLGLAEIVSNSGTEMVEEYAGKLLPTLQLALSDSDETVRDSAGGVFDGLLDKVGMRALDEIIPPLLKNIESGNDKEVAMNGLKAIIVAKPQQVGSYVIPRLLEPPVSTSVLAFLSSIVPDTFHEYLKKIIRALVNTCVKETGVAYQTLLEDAKLVVTAIIDYEGMRLQLDELIELSKDSERPNHRKTAIHLLSAIAHNKEVDLTQIQHQNVFRNTFKEGIFKINNN